VFVMNFITRICSIVQLSVGSAVTSESLDLERSVLGCRYILRRSRSGFYVKVIRSGSQEEKTSPCFVQTLNFRCLDVECSFLACRHMFGMSSSSSYIEVIWSRLQKQKKVCHLCCLLVLCHHLKGS